MVLWCMTQRHLITTWLPIGINERREIDTTPTAGAAKNDATIKVIARRS